jgi:His-Xaa-Ser system protein HxsD
MAPPPPGASIDVDTRMYSISAITRAAYKFTGTFHVTIRRPDASTDERVTVTLTPKSPSHTIDERMLAGDFENELIDQQLRETLEAEFGPVRELIVAHAFSDTNLLDSARDDGDYIDDPLGIGLPESTSRQKSAP